MDFACETANRRNLLTLAGCVGFIQIACYYLAAATMRGDGTLAIAQPDTLLYCQAARRIAEGFPFSYSSATAVSTGTTSVIYPFLLAVPYLLGAKGASFIAAGFVLNAAFYLIFLFGWCALACRIFGRKPAGSGPIAASVPAIAASMLLATFGPFAYCALAQSDIGLWMAVSAWLAYGLYCGRKSIYVPLLMLAPWVRPEGMILVAAYCAVGIVAKRREAMFVAVAAALSAAGVFALNYALTGSCQFSSVSHKGHFFNYSFPSAVYASAIDFMRIVKAYLLGLPQNAPRDFFAIPLVGAAFMWLGVFSRSWRDVSWREVAWHLAMAGGIVTVATSGWQNTNLDRYLIWIMPALLLYMVRGAEVCAAAFCRDGQSPCRTIPHILLVGFSAAMAVVFVWVFRFSETGVDVPRAFAARCEEAMPPGASIGMWGDVGAAYELSSRRVAHLSGIYSPEFIASTPAAKIEILKNEPSTRFDYWLCRERDRVSLFADKPDVVAGKTVLTAPPGLELRKADWSAYDAALNPAVRLQSADLKLQARIDVAYDADEKASGYEVLSRDGYPVFAPFTVAGKLNGTNVVEGGRFLFGGDSMTVPLVPGRDVHVVMRTALKCSATASRELGGQRSDIALRSPLTLEIRAEQESLPVTFDVPDGDFADVTFTIPGRLVTQPAIRLDFLGEHVAFCYWFFQ